MNEIENNSAVFSDLGLLRPEKKEGKSEELGQGAFLELMITQLENQNPLSPQENTEFISQLAQFSSVESLDKLNNNFDTFAQSFVANQALQASTLVGRSVSVPTDKTLLEAGSVVSAHVEVPASSGNVTLDIFAENGALVEQVNLGVQPAGDLVLRWDGSSIEVNGEVVDWQSELPEGQPHGLYKFDVRSEVEDEEVELEIALSANVNSVTVGQNGSLILNLAGIGAVSLADVKQFNE